MGFSRQESWSGLPFPPPGDLPDPGTKPMSPTLVGGFFTTEPPFRGLGQDYRNSFLFFFNIPLDICTQWSFLFFSPLPSDVFSRLVSENTPICLYSRCGLTYKKWCRVIFLLLFTMLLLTETKIPWTERACCQFIQSVPWTQKLVGRDGTKGGTHHRVPTLWQASTISLVRHPFRRYSPPPGHINLIWPLQGCFYGPKEALYIITANLHPSCCQI